MDGDIEGRYHKEKKGISNKHGRGLYSRIYEGHKKLGLISRLRPYSHGWCVR